MRGSTDLGAIRAHQELLKRHERELKAFDESLGAFHERFDPLGQKKRGDDGLPSGAPYDQVERRMARPARIELAAPRLGGGCSIR